MDILELLGELIPLLTSIFAVIVAFVKGRKVKTFEEIEQQAEAKKVKYMNKQLKKNKVTTPITENIATCEAINSENSSETHFGGVQ